MINKISITSTKVINDEKMQVNFSVNYPEELNFTGSFTLPQAEAEEMSIRNLKERIIESLHEKSTVSN